MGKLMWISFGFLIFSTLNISANEIFIVDDIRYQVITDATNEVEVTSKTPKYEGDVVIPKLVEYEEITYTVTRVGERAFYECNNLTSVIIGDSVKVIENLAFASCVSLLSVVFPEGLKTIGDGAFWGNEKLLAIEIFEGLETLGEGVFSHCTSLVEAKLPQSLRIIEWWTFAECRNLIRVTFSDSLTNIRNAAFKNCRKLPYFHMPNTVRGISDYAFEGCRSLDTVTFSESLTYIGTFLFMGCALTSVTLHEGITGLGRGAFQANTNLERIKLPASLRNIEQDAFRHCVKLSEISLPSELLTLGSSAFLNCSSLTSITIPRYVDIKWNTFLNCVNLEEVTIGRFTNTIEPNAFANTPKLETIVLNEYIKSVRDSVFNKSGLRHIELPVQVESVLSKALACENLEYIVAHRLTPPFAVENSFYGVDKTIPVYVPEEALELYQNATGWRDFFNFIPWAREFEVDGINYRTVSIVNRKVEVIAKEGGYSGDIVIPEEIIYNNRVYNAVSIGDEAFKFNESLTSVKMPSTMITIGREAFKACTNLISVEIGSSVTNIEFEAFRDCRALTTVEIPNSVINIGNYAFYRCMALASLEIPNSVKTIGNRAFEDCWALTSLSIGNSVETIGEWAFLSCNNLNSIISLSIEPPNVGISVFHGVPKNIPLYVPDESFDLYREADQWKDFIVTPLSQIPQTSVAFSTTDAYRNRGVFYGIRLKQNPVSILSSGVEFTVAVPKVSEIKVVIYDRSGRVVFSEETMTNKSGLSSPIVWNLTDGQNRAVAPGTYLIRVVAFNIRTSEVYRYSVKIGVSW